MHMPFRLSTTILFAASTMLVAIGGSKTALAAGETPPVERKLSDYANDDGRPPDGQDSKRDDTTALRKALTAGPGVVRIGPGFYRFGDVTIPSDVTLAGAGSATVIRPNGARRIFVQKAVHDWSIRDLVCDGETQGEWQARTDAGQTALFSEGCWGYEIARVALRNFNGPALHLTRTNIAQGAFSDGGTLDRVTATGNHTGICFDVRAEYIIATKLNCSNNVAGCVIHAGNTNISASNFGTNTDGLVIQDKENGSHGSISNCLLNHNTRYALRALNVGNGMAINNCCFFYGAIELADCFGVNITSGIIGCSVTTKGEHANRIAGNLVIPKGFTYQFAPATLVSDNFVKEGQWEQNNVPAK